MVGEVGGPGKAGGAGCGPGGGSGPRRRMVGELGHDVGEDMFPEVIEGVAVPVEARNGDAAGRIQGTPLLGVVVEVAAVGLEVGEVELGEAAAESLLHLAPDPPEAPPAEAEMGQGPLEEGDDVGAGFGQGDISIGLSGSGP